MLHPFANAAGTSIADLEIETDEDVLVLSGTLRIERDRESLDRLRRLSAVLTEAIASLEGSDLPDRVQPIAPGPLGPNPFEN